MSLTELANSATPHARRATTGHSKHNVLVVLQDAFSRTVLVSHSVLNLVTTLTV